MVKIIVLKEIGQAEIHVNADAINYIRPYTTRGSGSIITFQKDNSIAVEESPAEIHEQIDRKYGAR